MVLRYNCAQFGSLAQRVTIIPLCHSTIDDLHHLGTSILASARVRYPCICTFVVRLYCLASSTLTPSLLTMTCNYSITLSLAPMVSFGSVISLFIARIFVFIVRIIKLILPPINVNIYVAFACFTHDQVINVNSTLGSVSTEYDVYTRNRHDHEPSKM